MKRLMLLGLLLSALASCGVNHNKSQSSTPVLDGPRSRASDAKSYGTGEQAAFGGGESTQNDDQASLYVAPHNQTVHFGFDKSLIQEGDRRILMAQANYLKTHPQAKVVLAGHTDEIGSREYNVALSERRAKSVAEFMRYAGVTRAQMRLVSYGQEKPVALEHNQAAYKLNRRVELTYEVS